MPAAILGALFPIFFLILIGFMCGRAGWLGANGDHVLNAFVGKIALPALTLHVLAAARPDDLAQPVMAAVVVGASWLVFALHFLIEKRRGLDPARANFAALGAAYGNSAFVGLPICLAILGPASLGPSAVVMALNTAFVFGGGAVSAAILAGPGEMLRDRLSTAVRLVVTNPLVVAAATGVGLAMAGARLPAPAEAVLRVLGAATGPCALVAIGMFVARPLPRAGGTGATWRGIFGKLILLPAVTAALLWILPPLPGVWHDTALIMAAMPAGASCFVLARGAGQDAMRLVSRLVVLSTLGAALTLPLLLWLMNAGG